MIQAERYFDATLQDHSSEMSQSQEVNNLPPPIPNQILSHIVIFLTIQNEENASVLSEPFLPPFQAVPIRDHQGIAPCQRRQARTEAPLEHSEGNQALSSPNIPRGRFRAEEREMTEQNRRGKDKPQHRVPHRPAEHKLRIHHSTNGVSSKLQTRKSKAKQKARLCV
jgi:hypothetical protein